MAVTKITIPVPTYDRFDKLRWVIDDHYRHCDWYTEVVEIPDNRVQMHIEFPNSYEAMLFLMKWGEL